MSTSIEVSRDIVMKMIDKGIFDQAVDDVVSGKSQQQSELATQQICLAFKTIFQAVESAEKNRIGIIEAIYGTNE